MCMCHIPCSFTTCHSELTTDHSLLSLMCSVNMPFVDCCNAYDVLLSTYNPSCMNAMHQQCHIDRAGLTTFSKPACRYSGIPNSTWLSAAELDACISHHHDSSQLNSAKHCLRWWKHSQGTTPSYQSGMMYNTRMRAHVQSNPGIFREAVCAACAQALTQHCAVNAASC